MSEGLRAFAKRYRVSLNDPDLKSMYELEMSARRDRASMQHAARAEGIAEGMAQGITQGMAKGMEKGIADGMAKGMADGMETERMRTIRNMLNIGIPLDTIYKSIEAPRQEIDAIIENIRVR